MQQRESQSGVQEATSSIWRRAVQRGSWTLLAAAVTVLTASNLALMPLTAQAAPVAVHAAKAPMAANKYSKQALRARFYVPKPHGHKPHKNKTDYQSATYLATTNNLALATTSTTALPAPGPADLAQTGDVVFTPGIQNLAAALNHNPVAIYNWVRDHVVYTPTFGAMQGADATLQTLHGNAFDTASLLIALLRASNVPARYAYGTVQVPIAAAQNWVGGVSSPDAAVALFDQGGIPVQAVTSGGSITAVQIEEVWVDAYVDFNPSRGAVNRNATTWVPLDASYKQYRYTPDLGVLAGVPVDTAMLASQITANATSTANSVTGLNTSVLTSAFSAFSTQVGNYIAAHKPNATVADVLGSRATIVEDLPLLAGTLPYQTISVGAVYSDLPDTLRWQVQYGVYATDYDRTQGNAILATTQTLPQLVGKRLTVSFNAASATDQGKLSSQLNTSPLPTSLNAAAITTTAQLTLDGNVVATGGSIPFGTALVGGFGVFDPSIGSWTYTPDSQVTAGETQSLAAVGTGVSPAMLAASRDRLSAMGAQLAAHQYAGLTQDGLVGEILNYAGLAYATTVASNADLMCRACGIVGYALPTIVRTKTWASVTQASGVPQTVTFPGVALSVEMLGRTAVATDNNAAHALEFQRTFGEHASAYTDLLLDALFTDANHPGRTATTVRTLDAANAANQPIYLVTSANSASVLPQLTVDPGTQTVLQDAVGAGRDVTISQGPVNIGSWSGAGYLLEDPGVGSGDYEVAGRDEAQLAVTGGWLPLAMAGTGLSVPGDAVAAAIAGIPVTEQRYYAAAVALLADYGSIAWSDFVGANVVLSQWFLCDLWNGLNLTDPGNSLVSTSVVDTTTVLPGAPQSNSPPYFTSTPVSSGAVGQPYQYFATATDPDGDAIAFQLVSGPSGMSMSTGGLVTWASPVTGTYPVTVSVTDGSASVTQAYTLTVGQVMPLDLTLGITPQFVNAGANVTITVATTGGSGTVTKSLTVDGAPVALDANGQALITAPAAGAHPVVATASDNQGTLTRTSAFGVAVAGVTAPPTVQITAPADGTVLTAPTPVTGSVSDPNLALWQLLISPSGQGQWTELARGTAAINGTLGTLDPTQLTNGQYDLNLVATNANGLTSSTVQSVIVQGNLKLGLFTVSFNDLNLDVGGVPLTVTRTYDSRKKDIKGDFGYGWTLSYQNVNLQRNRPLGEQWQLYQTGLLTFCIQPIGKRVVSIALADGKVHQFDVVASPNCDTGQVPSVFSLAFNPRPGTTSTLQALDAADLLYQGGTVLDSNTGGAFDSMQYQLTTIDNYKYILTSSDNAQTFQVTQITDPNGETLTLTPQGATSSNGAALAFTRDAQGRITSVKDPAGRTVSYSYTAAGDLDSITSPTNQVSRNQYATVPATLAHLLTSYTDASGALQLRNVYDATGKLIAQYDALGNKVDLSQRDLTNHTQSVTDRNGNTSTYTFDDAGNITKTVDALGGVTTATFDSYANQLTTTDPLGRTTSTTYDTQSGTVLGTTDALGHTTKQTWNFYTMMGNNTPQNLQSTTDELGHTTSFGYTSPGMLRAITDPLGHSTSFGWGGAQFDQLTQMTDPTGHTTTYQNDAQGRKIQETDPLGNVTKYTYDAAGHLLTTTKTRVVNGAAQTLTTTNTVDANGNVLTTTDALGDVTKSTWTAQNQLQTQTDALGRTTTYGYDLTGRPTKTTYPDGTSESTAYDANGNATAQTDRAGRTTTTAYDALNRATTVTNPDGSATSTAYDAAGQVTAATDELGRSTSYQYDAAGRKTQVTDPASHATQFGYDAAGKLTSVTDALNDQTQYAYDAANRKTQTTWADGTTSKYGYDNAGRKTSDTDPANRTTQYAYDADGRLNQVSDPLSHVTKYGYDELGDKTRQTDALGHTTTWAYDGLGRATSHTLPDNRYDTTGYDAAGEAVNRTDYAGNATGYQYDADGRVIQQTFADGTAIATSYTPSGQIATLTLIANGSSKVTQYTYDQRDRLTGIVNPDNSKLHYVYDAAGQKTGETVTTPDGTSQAIDYTYDANGNLQTITANGKTFTYKYDVANRKIERDDPNGVVTQYTYDANGRLTGFTAQNGTTVLAKGTYTLNAAGQRTAMAYTGPDGNTRNLAYAYDGAGRLTGETRSLPAHTTAWTLDAVGNRTGQTLDGATSNYAYDVTDRLTGITGTGAATYTWDQNGQLASKTVGSGATAQKTGYTFNDRHQLTGVTLPDGSTVNYTYAADGNISQRTRTIGTTTQTTNYLVDPNLAFAQVVAEYDTTGHPTAIYVYGDELLMRIEPSGNACYHHDGLGSVVAMTDDTGAAIQTYGYDAWGNAVESTGADTNPYQFAGERFDADTGLIYLRARWYDPAIGRFVSADSTGGRFVEPITLNKYIYTSDDPANRADPSGLFTLDEEMEVVEIGPIVSSQLARIGGTAAGRGIVATVYKRAVIALAVGAATYVLTELEKRDQDRALPVIVFGKDMGMATKHYQDVILDNPKLGALSRRYPPNSRGWIYSKPGCKGMTGALSGLDCDEYPFAASEQGGQSNYRDGNGVSLRPVVARDNQAAGRLLGTFYGVCDISKNSNSDDKWYGVVADDAIPTSYFKCDNRKR